MLNRRGFLGGLIATLAAPAIIRTPGLLMPVKPPLILPSWLSVAPGDFVPFPPGMGATLRGIIENASSLRPEQIIMSQRSYDILAALFDETPAYTVLA